MVQPCKSLFMGEPHRAFRVDDSCEALDLIRTFITARRPWVNCSADKERLGKKFSDFSSGGYHWRRSSFGSSSRYARIAEDFCSLKEPVLCRASSPTGAQPRSVAAPTISRSRIQSSRSSGMLTAGGKYASSYDFAGQDSSWHLRVANALQGAGQSYVRSAGT